MSIVECFVVISHCWLTRAAENWAMNIHLRGFVLLVYLYLCKSKTVKNHKLIGVVQVAYISNCESFVRIVKFKVNRFMCCIPTVCLLCTCRPAFLRRWP